MNHRRSFLSRGGVAPAGGLAAAIALALLHALPPATSAADLPCLLPNQHRLVESGVGDAIVNTPVRLLLIGDSISAKTSPRMSGGIRRTWPVTWEAESTPPGITTGHDGTFVAEQSAVGLSRLTYWSHPTIYGGGQAALFATPVREYAFAFNIPDGVGFCQPRIESPAAYPLGDWVGHAPITGRMIFWRDAGMPSNLRVIASREGGAGALITSVDMSGAPMVDFVDFPVPDGPGAPAARLEFAPGASEAGQRIYHAATLFRRTDRSAFSLDVIATGGATATDHLNTAHCTDANLRAYLAATGHGEPAARTIFAIFLGTNMTLAEGGAVTTFWKSRIEQIIARYASAHAAIAKPAAQPPLFLLIVPYRTYEGVDSRRVQVGQALRQIADARHDCAVVDLYTALPISPTGKGDDPVHPESPAEADTIARALWREISLAGRDDNTNGVADACDVAAGAALDCNSDGVIDIAGSCPADFNCDGAVNAADLAQLLASWGRASSAQDLNGDGALNATDLALLLASWGACPIDPGSPGTPGSIGP